MSSRWFNKGIYNNSTRECGNPRKGHFAGLQLWTEWGPCFVEACRWWWHSLLMFVLRALIAQWVFCLLVCHGPNSAAEKRHSSSAVLPDCCVESHDVTETPCVLQRSLHVLCVHYQHLMEVSELIRQRNHRNMQWAFSVNQWQKVSCTLLEYSNFLLSTSRGNIYYEFICPLYLLVTLMLKTSHTNYIIICYKLWFVLIY